MVGAPVLAFVLAFLPLPSMLPDLRTASRQAPPPPLYGIFDVDSITRQGAVIPPLLTDTTLWRRVVFERASRASLTRMSDSVQLYRTVIDTVARTVQLSRFQRNVGSRINGQADTLRFSFARPDPFHLELRGVVAGESHVLYLRYTPASTYRLVNARHRWAW